MSQTFKTKALILKTTAYGDTSLIVLALTEMFGVQTYIIKGVRKGTKKVSAKANFFQPAALLEMVVYHHPLKQLNFVREFRWATIYQNIYYNVIKNAIALYCIELLQKCLKQPDDNPELYYFIEDVLQHLDTANNSNTANVAVFMALQLPNILGIQLHDNYNATNNILDLKDGQFTTTLPAHSYSVAEPLSQIISECLKASQPKLLEQIALNGNTRKQILDAMEIFYQIHISDFGKIKSLPILQQILS